MKITLILPTFNSEKYLQETLDSIENQDYYNIQLIAVDNESSDKSFEILKNHKSKFEYVYSSAPNLYKYTYEEPVLEAFKHMTGEWFTVIGSDDVLDSNYVSTYKNIINRLGHKYKCFQSNLKTFNLQGDSSTLSHKYANIDEFKKLYLTKCPVNTPTVFYHKDMVSYWEPCANLYLGANDYWIYGNIVNDGNMIYPVPFSLGYNYRLHEGQATWKMIELGIDKKVQQYWREKWKM